MRVVAHVFLGYGLMLVLGALWPYVPLPPRLAPDVLALVAMYLGLTARHRVAGPTLGAVILGYLGDLLVGSPRGVLALTSGLLCILGHLVHRSLLVRGPVAIVAISLFTGAVSGVLVLAVRAYLGVTSAGSGGQLGAIGGAALATAIAGPLIFKLCRLVDARLARTWRERDRVLEGITS